MNSERFVSHFDNLGISEIDRIAHRTSDAKRAHMDVRAWVCVSRFVSVWQLASQNEPRMKKWKIWRYVSFADRRKKIWINTPSPPPPSSTIHVLAHQNSCRWNSCTWFFSVDSSLRHELVIALLNTFSSSRSKCIMITSHSNSLFFFSLFRWRESHSNTVKTDRTFKVKVAVRFALLHNVLMWYETQKMKYYEKKNNHFASRSYSRSTAHRLNGK